MKEADWAYTMVEWLWSNVPGLRRMPDDSKAIASLLALNAALLAGLALIAYGI